MAGAVRQGIGRRRLDRGELQFVTHLLGTLLDGPLSYTGKPNNREAQMIRLNCYEIWSHDDQTHIVTVWVDTDRDANRIANALGGVAHYEMCGIAVPDESYLKID